MCKTSRDILMTIESFCNPETSNWLLAARDKENARQYHAFWVLVTNFSIKPFLLHYHKEIDVGTESPSIVGTSLEENTKQTHRNCKTNKDGQSVRDMMTIKEQSGLFQMQLDYYTNSGLEYENRKHSSRKHNLWLKKLFEGCRGECFSTLSEF